MSNANVLLINLGTSLECFLSTTILKKHRINNSPISFDVLTKNEISRLVFKYNDLVKNSYSLEKYGNVKSKKYNVVLNLNPEFSEKDFFYINADAKFGFSYQDLDEYKEVLFGNRKTGKNIFQIYHGIEGSKWSGESFDLIYRPANKTTKKVGIILSNLNLKNYIVSSLEEVNKDILNVKNNIFKKIDDINKYEKIITDDFFTMNAAVYLNKEVEFLIDKQYNFKIESFGKAKLIEVPKTVAI